MVSMWGPEVHFILNDYLYCRNNDFNKTDRRTSPADLVVWRRAINSGCSSASCPIVSFRGLHVWSRLRSIYLGLSCRSVWKKKLMLAETQRWDVEAKSINIPTSYNSCTVSRTTVLIFFLFSRSAEKQRLKVAIIITTITINRRKCLSQSTVFFHRL